MSGNPVDGTIVHAALRLPASALPADTAQAGVVTTVPLAVTETGNGGAFELRSVLPSVPAAFLADGWAHVVVSALAPDGSWSLAMDSMRFVPGPDGTGLWATTMRGADAAERLLSGVTIRAFELDQFEAAELDAPDQRPERLVLNPPQEGVVVPFRAGPGEPYSACTPLFTEGPPQNGFRTVADIDMAPAWSFKIQYEETDSTAWEIGYEKKGQTSNGVEWGVAGTASFSDTESGGYDSKFGPYPEHYREAFQVQLVHVKVVWRCGDHKSPGPFYVRTVEPREWTGGTWNEGDPQVECNRKHQIPVAGNTLRTRKIGKASKYSAAGNVWGFNGRASVEYSKVTILGWMNHLETPRHICGESGHPIEGKTRVVALSS